MLQLATTTDGCKPRVTRRLRALHGTLTVAVIVLQLAVTGCKGRSIKEENPVFADAPPRRSLINKSADQHESILAGDERPGQSNILPVGFEMRSNATLTGTTIVATVNGKPVFVDDVLGSGRKLIEGDKRLTDDQQQMLLREALKKRLTQFCEDELIMHALEQKIPADKRELLKESLEPRFQEWLAMIKKEKGITSDEQLEEMFAQESMTIDLLRDTFMRIQMVSGYLASLDKTPAKIDRNELVSYYQEHLEKYTTEEQVRFAEIVVRFADHGGREGSEKVMATVVTKLQQGEDFGKVAAAMSDTLSAERQGDRGWITRKDLSDPELLELLFTLPVGSMSKVQVRDDRFEVYRVIDHKLPESQPFQSVQKQIEEKLLMERKLAAREQIRKDIRAKGVVVTMFDQETAGTK